MTIQEMGEKNECSLNQRTLNSRYVYGPHESGGPERSGVVRISELYPGKPREAISSKQPLSAQGNAQP